MKFSGWAVCAVLCLLPHLPSALTGQGTPPATGSSADAAPITLTRGEPVERALAASEVQSFQVTLAAGDHAALTVEQRGIDVIVRVEHPSGQLLAEFDSEARLRGREPVCLVADAPGAFRIEIQSRYPKAASGRYAIRLDRIQAATDRDRDEFESRKLNTTAAALVKAGKYKDANRAMLRALELAERALGPNDAYVGQVLIRCGDLARMLGDAPTSERLLLRAVAIGENALGVDDPQTALARTRLGAAYTALEQYGKAETTLDRAVASTERTLGSDHPRIAEELLAVGEVRMYLEDNEYARTCLLRGLAIAEKTYEPDAFAVTSLLHNLAEVSTEMGDLDNAEMYDTRALAGLEKQFGPNSSRVANVLMTLGIIARRRAQYPHALELLTRAYTIREQTLGSRHPDTASVLITIGNLRHEQGDYTRALEAYHQALDVFTASAPFHEYTRLALFNAARSYVAAGDIEHAFEYERRARSLLETTMALSLAVGSEREKLAFVDQMRDFGSRAITLHIRFAPDRADAAADAVLGILQYKGRVLDSMSGTLAALRTRSSAEDREAINQFERVTGELATLTLSGRGSTPLEDYSQRLASLQQQRDQLESKISDRSAAFRAQSLPVTIASVQSAIPQEAALIELAVYHPYNPRALNATAFDAEHYVAYVLRHDGGIRWKELGPAASIDTAVEALRGALRNPARTDVRRLARALDAKVLEPIRAVVGDATRLLVSPDGELNLIPFEALVDEHGRYAVERYDISYLTSGRDLLRMQLPRASQSGPLIVTAPAFGEPATTANRAVSQTAARLARRSVTVGVDFSRLYFAPLPGTVAEGRAIKALFPDASVLTGEHASKSSLLRVRAPKMLHIATHGFFLERAGAQTDTEMSSRAPAQGSSTTAGAQTETASIANPLLRSGLALSGANLTENGRQDGILTALEASTLNLWGTELVTLSACDTAVGDIKNGEGVYGLRRAFLLAGAQSLVMSLWPVSDYVTREMMSTYYAGLKQGLGRGEALRHMQRMMLAHAGRRHPYYWASFIQAGEWTPIDRVH